MKNLDTLDNESGVVGLADMVHRRAAEVARAVRAGDTSAELDARRELAFTRAEVALRKILGPAPRLRSEQADRLIRVVTDRAEVSVPVTFGAE